MASAESAGVGLTGGANSVLEIVATSDTSTTDSAPASDTLADDTTSEGEDGSSTDSGGGEFSGSSKPASPDLSIGEEKALISGGWN